MKKSAIIILTIISTVALCLSLMPTVTSQIEDVEVLSYSYYMKPYYEDTLVIVGEVQNTGPNIINSVIVTGTFYAPDETVFMTNYIQTLTTQIMPQQKSPFYLTFSPDNIMAGTNWTAQDVTEYEITVTAAETTETQQYQDLTVLNDELGTDTYGYYYVSGTVKNTGTQSTNATWVVATFYNSTGDVVSLGYSSFLTPTSIAPGGTADFVIYTADYTSAGAIDSYSLVIQTKLSAVSNPTPTPSPTANPSSSPTATPTPTGSASPTPTPSEGGTIPDTYIYAAVVAVVAVIAIVGVLALRKRSGKKPPAPQ